MSITFAIYLHIIVAVCAVAEPPEQAADSMQVSEWGEEVRGLQCRATMPRRIEQGMSLEITVEFRALPDKVPAEIMVFYPGPDVREFIDLRLEDPKTGALLFVEGRYFGQTFGFPFERGESAVPLDGKQVKPSQIAIPLTRAGPDLKPGSYRCSIRYEQPDERLPHWHGTGEEWRALGAWHGRTWSAPVMLEVLREVPETEVLLLPKRLRVIRKPGIYEPGGGELLRDAHLLTTFAAEDAESINFPARNGYGFLHKVTVGQRGLIRGGPPKPEDMNGLDQWQSYRGDGRKLTYRMTLFETCDDEYPFPGPCSYNVLWEKLFDLDLTAEQLDAVLDGREPFALSGEAREPVP